MATPPLKTELSDTYPSPSNAVMRAGMSKLWETLFGSGGLLGADGTPGAARAALGVAIGSNVQAYQASASQAEMEAGTESALRAMSPLLVRHGGLALPTFRVVSGISSTTTLTPAWYGCFIQLSGTITITLPVATVTDIGKSITFYAWTTAEVSFNTQSSQLLYAKGQAQTLPAVLMRAGDSITITSCYNSGGFMVSSSSNNGSLYANVFGYGAGSGGAVTQATSKSTAVTLNKPCGVITTNTETMVAGDGRQFILYNSLLTENDELILTSQNVNYVIRGGVQNGQANIVIINGSGVSQGIAVKINFAIIKGSAS